LKEYEGGWGVQREDNEEKYFTIEEVLNRSCKGESKRYRG
jgi:hypothetical protein